MLDNKQIADRIRIRRNALRMTQEELAHKLDIYKNTVDHWESGSKMLTVEEIQKVAEALKVPAAHFFPENPAKKLAGQDGRFSPVVDELTIAASHDLLTPELVDDIARYIRFRVDESGRAWGVSTTPSEIDADRREQIYLQEKAKRERLAPAHPAGDPQWLPPPPGAIPPPGSIPLPFPKRTLTLGDRITAGMAVVGALAILGVWAVNRASSRSAAGGAKVASSKIARDEERLHTIPGAAAAASAALISKTPESTDLQVESEMMKRQAGWVILDGTVRNNGRQSLAGAQALTSFSDAHHRPIEVSTALVKADPIPPGSTSTYTVYVKDNPSITNYKTVFHVLKAAETAEDTQEPAPTSVAPHRRNRREPRRETREGPRHSPRHRKHKAH